MISHTDIIRKFKLLYSTSAKFQILIRKVFDWSLYLWLLKRWVNYQIVRGKQGPFNLIIETSSRCNRSCSFCPQAKMKRPKKIMSENVFRTIVRRIDQEKIKINKVFLSGLGEPLLDSRLIDRVKRLKSLGLPVRLYTNGTLLTEEKITKLEKIGLDEINISLNSINQKLRIEQKKRRIKIRVSLVATNETSVQIKKFIGHWRSRVDSVTVTRPHQWGGGVKIISKFEILRSVKTFPCRSLWHTFMIDSNGNYVVCCRDYESVYRLGNVVSHSFAQIGESLTLKRFQLAHLRYSGAKLPKICQRCNFPYQGGVDWFLPRSID